MVTVPAVPWLTGVRVRRDDAEAGIAVAGGEAASDEPNGVKVRVAEPGMGAAASLVEPAGDEAAGVKVRVFEAGRTDAGSAEVFGCWRSSLILGSDMVSGLAGRGFGRGRPRIAHVRTPRPTIG
jgi:hypothetical protein